MAEGRLPFCKKCFSEKNCQSVIDVGCGSGHKLIHYPGAYKSTGVEVAGTSTIKASFSTPEGDVVAGKNDYGPPENPSRYREWNTDEIKNYISGYFIIDGQRIFNGRSVIQVITCKK